MASEDSIDEKVWNGEALVNPQDPYWRTVNPRNVHLLFYESDFFDRMSNNQALLNQSQYDEKIWKVLFNRKDFEQAVMAMPSGGLEFITLSEPHPMPNFDQGFNDPRYEPHGTNGTYVFQKQTRKKVPGRADEITVLGQYYMIGFMITQAPSIYDVLTSQFLFTTQHIGNALKKAVDLPVFNPSQDHYGYFKLNTKAGSAHGPRHGSQSRASTPPQDTASQIAPARQGSSAQTSARAAEAFLYEALTASVRYGSEYMDENPLMGEPGSFVFSSTNMHVQQQNQQKQASEQARSVSGLKHNPESDVSTTTTPKPTIESQMAQLQGKKTGKDIEKPRQPSVSGQIAPKKRKKSKAPGSPTSPTSASPTSANPAGNPFP